MFHGLWQYRNAMLKTMDAELKALPEDQQHLVKALMAGVERAGVDFDGERIDAEMSRLGRIRIPAALGKYGGLTFSEVPLRYLDETIATMIPAKWLSRSAARYVDLAMEMLEIGRADRDESRVPNEPFGDAESRLEDALFARYKQLEEAEKAESTPQRRKASDL